MAMSRVEYEGVSASSLLFFSETATRELDGLCWNDSIFRKQLKKAPHLQRVFEILVTNGEDALDKEDVADQIAMLYIEHALLNRGTFACAQKKMFSKRYVEIPLTTRDDTKNIVETELNYVSSLLSNINTSSLIEMRNRLEFWKDYEVGTTGNDRDHDDDTTDDTGNHNGNDRGSDIDGYHVIPYHRNDIM